MKNLIMATNDNISSDVIDVIASAAADSEDGTDFTSEGPNPSEIELDRRGPTVNTLTILPQEHAGAGPGLPQFFQQLSLSSVPQDTNVRNIINIVSEINFHQGSTEEKLCIPDYLKDRIQAAKKIFVETKGYHQVWDALDCHGHVLISGSPGCGKTMMSLYIMDKYMKKNYNVIFLDDLSNFDPQKHIKHHVPTLLVFDDVFGKFTLTTKKLVDCKGIFGCLKSHFSCLEERRRKERDKGNGGDGKGKDTGAPFKVIMNSRTNVLDMIISKLREYSNSLLRPSTIADLTTLTKLSDDEKEKILTQHLLKGRISINEDKIRKIAQLEYSSLGFPYLCELFVDSRCSEEFAVEFFKQPMTYLVDLVSEIFAEESKERASVLLLMVLSDGILRLTHLQSKELRKESRLDEKLEKCEEIVGNLPGPLDLSLAARHENHTLLVSEGDTMKFSHPTIHDAVAFVVGDKNPLFVLENCTLQFILERTRVNLAVCSPSSGDFHNFVINLSPDTAIFLVRRLAKEIMALNFALSLSHQCFSSEDMVRLLFKELSFFDNMEKCLHSQDEQFGLSFLFWSSFISMGPMCEITFEHISVTHREIMEGCFGCCMSGNVGMLRVLVSSSSSPIEEITTSTLGNILERPNETKSFYRSLSTAGSPTKPDVPTEKETPRMHGDNRDMLIHISAANGFPDIVQILIELGTGIDVCGGNKMTPLMHACYLGHTELMNLLLAKGADPLLLDEEGDNCLHLACRGGSTGVVKLLHEKQVNLNTRGEHERTPLMYASYNGHANVVKLLLEQGATPEPDMSSIDNKENCLHLACVKGHTNVAIILLEQGNMDIEMLSHKKRTPLMYACRHGQLETAKELAIRGANCRVVDLAELNCLHMAAIGGHVPTAEWLLGQQVFCTVDCLSEKNRTPLMLALQNGHTELVQFLIEQGADLDHKDINNMSCLHFAVTSGTWSLVEMCLERGNDINSITTEGVTPADEVCRHGKIALLQRLVEKGADLTIGKSGGCLHSAAFNGHIEIVKYLSSDIPEVDINRPGLQKKTPLMLACSRSFIEVAKYLIECGADILCKDQYQRTCLHLACQDARDKCTDMVEWLLSLGRFGVDDEDANGYTPLMYAVKSERFDVIEILTQNGSDMHRVDRDGRTCLHLAAWHGKAKSCKTLLNLGMNVDVLDRSNKTPLMAAVSNWCDRNEVVMSLLENGADINQRTPDGDSCLHNCSPVNVDILLNHGLHINDNGAYSQTPIMLACKKGNKDLFDLMLQRGADVHLLNRADQTCLHLASLSNKDDTHIVCELLDIGLDPNVLDQKNKTPLIYAVSKLNVNILEVLILRGGNLKICDQKGNRSSLLHYACGIANMGNDIPQLLIHRGIDVNFQDRLYRTPVMYAAKQGNRALAEFLIQAGADLGIVDQYGKTCISHAEDDGHQELAEYLDTMMFRYH